MLKNYDDALLDFDKAVELTPQAAEAYAGRGSLRVLAHDFDGANADLEKALQLNPKSAPAFAGRGFLRINRGITMGLSRISSRWSSWVPNSPKPISVWVISRMICSNFVQRWKTCANQWKWILRWIIPGSASG